MLQLKLNQKPHWLLFFFLYALWYFSNIVCAETFIPYGTPSLDGVLSRGEWLERGHVRMARFYGFDQFADFWLQWDQDNLYIAGHLDDYTLFEDGGKSHQAWDTSQDDSIEIYLHPGLTPPSFLNEQSRVLAFSITGREQRLDRGRWGNERADAMTTGLELFNTTGKIGNAFLNVPIRWENICSKELNTPLGPEVTVKFAHQAKGSINDGRDRDQGWQFEVALPWRVMGTEIGKKIVGANCTVGDGIIPVSPNPQDGMPIYLNFYRVNDEEGGEVNTFERDGIQKDEWFVYQGDRYRPQEWARFILSHKTDPNDVPKFESSRFDVTLLEGRRVRFDFDAPQRGHAMGGAASRYLIRFQKGTLAVNEESWENMQPFENAYLPALPGTRQTLEVIGLEANTTYTFALRAQDEVGRQSREILNRTTQTTREDHPFVTVSPTGRNLVLTDGKPFVVVGETGLMPWLPLRGLYTGDLCDEHPPTDSDFRAQRKVCGQEIMTHNEQLIEGRIRNYSTEKLFFDCHLQDGRTIPITDITELGKDSFVGPEDNCRHEAGGMTITEIEAVEGPEVAKAYLRKLKAAGVNTLTVFVESLDLNATPILFEAQRQHIFNFLDSLIELARENEVYLLIRLYDTYHYKRNNYKRNDPQSLKWNETLWAKKYGKSSPEGFFDEDIYSTHLDRMNQLFTRIHPRTRIAYRDEPHILGWDLVNEIDNGERFNQASYEKRKKWTETMLAYAKREAPHQLAFFSFLTWEPKDDDVHYRRDLGMDAQLAYRSPGADIAMPHGYYQHVANPHLDPQNVDYEGPVESVRGTIYGFYQIRDGRPLLDGESAPSPLFIDEGNAYQGRFTEQFDMTRFLGGAWLHFASGGAGANLHWPIDLRTHDGERDPINQISPEKRKYLEIFKKHVGDIPWRGDQMNIAHRKVGQNIVQVSRFDQKHAVIFLYNQYAELIREVTLADLPPSTAQVKVINPRDDRIVYENNSVEVGQDLPIRLNGINDHVAVLVRDMKVKASSDCLAVTDNLGIGATIYTENKGPIKAVWKQGGEAKTNRGDQVIWGYFHASRQDVDWGSENNPDMFVKIWNDVSGRVDVNFFHVSVPDIEVLSCMEGVEPTPQNVASTSKRYVIHTYESKRVVSKVIETSEMGSTRPDANPRHNEAQVQGVQIGASLQTEEKGPIDGIWRLGGSDTTARGDQVSWGFFYAHPNDVGWGQAENPEVYVKVWYDRGTKRVDVNFFHVSAPNIKVYSTGTARNDYEQGSTLSQGERYTRHIYQK